MAAESPMQAGLALSFESGVPAALAQGHANGGVVMLEQAIEKDVEGRCFRFRERLEQPVHRAVDGGRDGDEQALAVRCQREKLAPPVLRMRHPLQQLPPLQQADDEACGRSIEAQQLRKADLIERPTIRLQRREHPELSRCQIEGAAFIGKDRQRDLIGPAELETGALVECGDRLCIG
jgi:hypothetical protein